MKGGVSVASISYYIGPSCMSMDEMFQSLKCREILNKYNKELGAYNTSVACKGVESKGKT
jgi:hypothetical protein